MGIIISKKEFFLGNDISSQKPYIFCDPPDEEFEKAISLNRLLAEEINRINSQYRTMRLNRCFNKVLDKIEADAIIKDFDVLFNPVYQIDVLLLLINACRRKSFRVIWPGKYEDGKLIYAEDGYADFKSFDINDYDITCIV